MAEPITAALIAITYVATKIKLKTDAENAAIQSQDSPGHVSGARAMRDYNQSYIDQCEYYDKKYGDKK